MIRILTSYWGSFTQDSGYSPIPNAKERFWDCVIIDMLINNNDRNEDNWGVIKCRKSSSYRLAPVFDCGNCFYGKTDEERIAKILDDETRLFSSALNGITAYEDDEEKRIRNSEILLLDNSDLRQSIIRVYELVKDKLAEINRFIDDVPSDYDGLLIMSEERKRFYKETLRLRFVHLLEPQYLALKNERKE